ncbi:MAG TPA: Lpg1974 family pore-forming outer membrane protein [Rhabdochlamydiaceae bacterium]|nr:Lpg1974 family pore-forming outer membrane protein [Rhabdochlamydiaceae bacterium]
MNLRNFRLTTIFIQCLPLLLYSDFQEEEETFSSCCFYQETSAGHCFNPPARKDVQGNIIGHIDFLLLMAQEEGLAYAIKDPVPVNFSVGAPVPLPQNGRVKHVQIGFHPGLRATLIGNLPHDGWDMALSWTHFSYDQRKNTVSDVSNNSLFPIRGVSTLIGNLVHKAGAKWDLRFDTLDLGLGRAYWIGDFLSVHPILGVRSAWIKQDFNITYTFVTTGSNGNSALRASSFRSKDRNHFWELGLLQSWI